MGITNITHTWVAVISMWSSSALDDDPLRLFKVSNKPILQQILPSWPQLRGNLYKNLYKWAANVSVIITLL